MVGHPKHVAKALAVGADLICAQGGEGGGVSVFDTVDNSLVDDIIAHWRHCWHYSSPSMHRRVQRQGFIPHREAHRGHCRWCHV